MNAARVLITPVLACVALDIAGCADVSPVHRVDPDASVLGAAIEGPCRSPANVKRDVYRHPAQTLRFFGIGPGMRVIEITPGYCWYCEILAPYLSQHGDYIAAVHVSSTDPDAPNVLLGAIRRKFAETPQCFRSESIRTFDIAAPTLGSAGSADLVLTFRNVHNWEQDGYSERMFQAIAAVLKPGGILGVTDHRADGPHVVPSQPPAGYIAETRVIGLATAAGLELIGNSEINANPRDRKDCPAGVWTLPPTLVLGEQDASTYLDIGESDRMTLRFRKPIRATNEK